MISREYKFRLWNKEDRRWVSPSILEVWDDSGKLKPFEFVQTGTLNPLYTPVEHYLMQQGIGLRDYNSVDIYEGDIIENQVGRQFIVEWVGISFQFREIEIVKDKVKTDCVVSNVDDLSQCCRVIGNICEHPTFIIK